MRSGVRTYFRRRIKDLVLGANDGIITTFAIVTGATGASLSPRVALVLGIANLFADGLSMGASNYLGRKSEADSDATADPRGALGAGLATFAAFVVAGAIPLVAFLVPMAPASRFPAACALTAGALFGFGAMRAVVTRRSWLYSGLEMLAIGAAAAVVAYVVGWALAGVAGLDMV
ncbi:VIT1/CCC1 transporter family protein [Coralloluteibacterium thermophilus]|uniref:VIT1/CCC1 transporter family protein n=1 Tax=Coralloluteibacterium thermophilum TaxID=2707049 RepID=A0ABV9NL21_9GAMM